MTQINASARWEPKKYIKLKPNKMYGKKKVIKDSDNFTVEKVYYLFIYLLTSLFYARAVKNVVTFLLCKVKVGL